LLSALAVTLSGCLVGADLKASDPETWRPSEKLFAEQRYAELSASPKQLNAELRPRVRLPEGARTDFGDQLFKLARDGVRPEIKAARAALADPSHRAEALARFRR